MAKEDVAVVDLSRFEAMNKAQEDGIETDLFDEAGKPIGMKLTIHGPDSAIARKAVKDVAKQFAAKAEARGDLSPSEDDEDERMIAYLAKVTSGWSPNPSIGGKAVPFSEDNALRFFSLFRMFAEQARGVALRRAPFARGSSTTSAD
jgi:hypothetical protein